MRSSASSRILGTASPAVRAASPTLRIPNLFGFDFGLDPRHYVALIWVFIGLLYFIIFNLWRSRVGRAWYATKQDEDAAEILGVPTFRMKLLAFATGASTAGFAGAVYSSYVGYIIPANFVLITAIMVLASVVLGGMGNMKGAMVGAGVIVFLPEIFRAFNSGRFLIFGSLLVVMMILRPEGLFPLRPRRYLNLPTAAPDLLSLGTAPADRSRTPILECRGITKRFGGVTAIKNVDLVVPDGGVFALIGPNGAGKSTLFNLISGSVRPNEGEVILRGRPIARHKSHEIAAAGIARTFQLIRLFPAVLVIENVLVGADIHVEVNPVAIALGLPVARRSENRALAIARAALVFCDIEHLAHRLASSLSYGDQRRVEIARALASAPKLLLLDEPAAGMNPTERKALARAHSTYQGRRHNRGHRRARHQSDHGYLRPCGGAGERRDYRVGQTAGGTATIRASSRPILDAESSWRQKHARVWTRRQHGPNLFSILGMCGWPMARSKPSMASISPLVVARSLH